MSKMWKKFLMASVLWVALLFAGLNSVWATALSDSRDTPQREGTSLSIIVASNVIIYAGSMVCADTNNGYARPAADTAGFAVIGMAEAEADNRTATYSSTRTVKVIRGIFRWENADSIADSDIGKIVYVTDDQTVNKTGGGNNIIAGAVVDVDSDGVWVDTAKIGPIGASTPSSLAVSGAGTIGTTLGVSGNTTVGGTLTVTKTVTNSAHLVVGTNATVGGVLTVTGPQTNAGAMTVAGTLAASGNETVAGVLTVTGPQTNASPVTIIGKYALVGGDASTGLMIVKGTFTNQAATVTFPTAFQVGATPVVVCNWTDDYATWPCESNAAIFVTGITSNQFVPKDQVPYGKELTNANYIAIGTRPQRT